MPSPEETADATREFLADHPEAEAPLAALLERDADGDPWTFAETELDSGRFGELVSRDLATAVEDGYRLNHPDAIRRAIDGAGSGGETHTTDRDATTDTSESETSASSAFTAFLGDVDRNTTLALVGALLTVAAARLVAAPSVFRDGYVVSPSNDPYFFRYWQERLAARADGIADLALFADMGAAASTRPLSHAINWWVTVLFGGVDAAPFVAAWLPVVSAVCLGYVVYRVTRLLTGDVRIALAAVIFYALAPVNAMYTTVGFLDHNAQQYLWLGVLIFMMTALAVDVSSRSRQTDPATASRAHARSPRAWMFAGGLAIAVAASAHLWGGSPLTFVPVAAVVGLRVALDVRHDSSPVFGNAPLLVGLILGAGLTLIAHLGLGWHESIAAATPLLVAGGALIVVAAGELWRRTDLSATVLVGIEVLVAIGGLSVYRLVRPADVERLRTRADALFFREDIAETASLFNPDFAFVFGPVFQLGLGFYFGIAVLAATTWVVTRRYEPGWLVLVCFGWYYLLLATLQVRFAGQLAIIIAPFAGIGLLYLLAAVDLARPLEISGLNKTDDELNSSRRGGHSRGNTADDGDNSMSGLIVDANVSNRIPTIKIPDGARMRGYLAVTITLVLLFNLIFVPSLVGQTTHDRAQFDAAQTVNAHADAVDREHPQNFVLSHWGDNRMYNYFVSGESERYGYAQSNHESFLIADDPDEWHDRFQGRVGYVVITDHGDAPPTNTTYEALHEGLGIGANNTSATAHYQLLVADDGVRTFAVVPGATIRVDGVSDGHMTAKTSVAVGTEAYEYSRTGAVEEGTAMIQVAHPGEYRIGNETIVVTDEDVLTGATVEVSGS